MDRFLDSCAGFDNYPTNLVDSIHHPYELHSYSERFSKSQRQLCCTEVDDDVDEWGIHFWECPSPRDALTHTVADDLDGLQSHLGQTGNMRRADPISRFAFLHAPHAREKLNTTAPMLKLLLSHHQVTASIVDQLLSYGRRKHEQEFSACGFRQEARLSPKYKEPAISELGRSGRRLQLCYTLRTIEDPEKWTMRQTSTYHSFDVVSGKSFWIIVKADTKIRERIQSAAHGAQQSIATTFGSADQCLESALSSHLVVCNWANENWRPYIGELELQIHNLTKKATAFEASPSAPTTPRKVAFQHNTRAPQVTPVPSSRRNTLERAGTLFSRPFSRRSTSQADDAPQVISLNDVENGHHRDLGDEESFSIEDMQTIQIMEEKANSALLVLKTNADTLAQMKDFYSTIEHSDGWPHDLRAKCAYRMVQFAAQISNIENDLRLQQARLETLIRLLADRKALLYAIIEYRNTLANKDLAMQAQESQKHMENMTREMGRLAEKTQQETVSMRIITLVTLFFLPGTFISTLMSTDIVQFEFLGNGVFEEQFSSHALELFLEISIPLMVGSFLAWWVIYLCTKHRRERMKFVKRVKDHWDDA